MKEFEPTEGMVILTPEQIIELNKIADAARKAEEDADNAFFDRIGEEERKKNLIGRDSRLSLLEEGALERVGLSMQERGFNANT